jgi:hypothetical protein
VLLAAYERAGECDLEPCAAGAAREPEADAPLPKPGVPAVLEVVDGEREQAGEVNFVLPEVERRGEDGDGEGPGLVLDSGLVAAGEVDRGA